jgi:hypothetical protein
MRAFLYYIERVPRSAGQSVLGWKLPLSVIAVIARVVYSVKSTCNERQPVAQ